MVRLCLILRCTANKSMLRFASAPVFPQPIERYQTAADITGEESTRLPFVRLAVRWHEQAHIGLIGGVEMLRSRRTDERSAQTFDRA